MTILYVDDDQDDAEIFCIAVHEVDPAITFVSAEDGKEMLKFLNINCPDFIFIDHNMPGSGSLKLLEQIRSTPCFGSGKVIVYSNYLPEKVEWECRNLGVFVCWEKTSDFNGLCKRIRALLTCYIQE